MVKLTMIARVTDGLPLAEGLDDCRDLRDADFYRQQAKLLFKKLSKGHHDSSRLSIETGPYLFHYIIEGRVCYLTMCDRSYPKKLAFQYLEDLKNEFERVNGSQIETAARPYAFIRFDTFIQKTRKLYLDTRTQRNLAKLNDELYEVHQIMTRNVQEVLGVGEKLDQVSEMSSRLTRQRISIARYADKAKDLNRQVLVTKIGPWGGNGGVEFDITNSETQRLESVTITSGVVINSIAFSYIDLAGKKQTLGPWGGDGELTDTIVFAPLEIVKEVSGTTGTFDGDTAVTSLTFTTNVRTYGPFGKTNGGTAFSVPLVDSNVVGFFVHSGRLVNALGVYVRPYIQN